MPKTTGEAIASNSRYFFNGRLCKHEHLCPRHVSGECVVCLRKKALIRQREYGARKRGESKWERKREWRLDLATLIESGLPKSKEEAIKTGDKYFYSGIPCKNNHYAPRTIQGICLQCRRDRALEYLKRKQAERVLPYTRHSKSYKHGKSYSIEQMLYNSAKQRAHNKGVEFTITVEDIIIPTHCPILGLELSKVWGGAEMNNTARAAQPSLDRLDPRKGYVPGNVIVISYRANTVKGEGLASEHRAVAAHMRKIATARHID